jgi:hypothetical protein
MAGRMAARCRSSHPKYVLEMSVEICALTAKLWDFRKSPGCMIIFK